MTNAAPTPESTPTAADAARVSLKSRVVSSSMWMIFSYGASQLLRLGGNWIFSKLLYPEAFGLMLLVNVFVTGLAMFSDIGIGPSIIQSRRGEEPTFLNTAWTVQVARGFILWLVSLIAARPFAAWYGEPQLAELVPVSALAAVLSGFNSTRLFSSERRIAVARITQLDFASQTVGLITMVILCVLLRNVWAIVFGSLVTMATKMVLTFVVLEGERNAFAFDRDAFREMTRFGRWVFASTSLSFLTNQIGGLMLGKFVPIGVLGVYSFAMSLASVPPTVALTLTGGVLFPLLAHHSRTDARAYERALFDARRFIIEGAMFLFAGLALVSPAFFRILYDQRYAGAAWMTQLLTVPMWAWILMLSADRAVLATGDSRTLAFSNAASLVTKLAACYLGFHLAGVVGFIFGLAVGNLAGHVPIVIALQRRGIHVLKQDLPYTAIAVSAIGGAVLIQHWGVTELGERWRNGLELLVAAAVLTPMGMRLARVGREALSRR